MRARFNDIDIFKIENLLNEFVFVIVNRSGFFTGFGHQQNFFFGYLFILFIRIDAEQTQNTVGRNRQQPNKRGKDNRNDPKHTRHGKGHFSAFRMAIRLGINSPKTILKYAKINVMRITQIV